jgi:hypothetical protein
MLLLLDLNGNITFYSVLGKSESATTTTHVVRSEVLRVATVKIVFWNVTPCSLIVSNIFEELIASVFRVEEYSALRLGNK